MSLFAWCTRRAGGLSLIFLLFLCYWVLSSEIDSSDTRSYRERFNSKLYAKTGRHFKNPDGDIHNAGNWTVFLAYYSILIHACLLMFPLRACWAVADLTRSLRKVARNKALNNFKFSHQRRLSSTSLSSADTLTSQASSSTSSEAGDVEMSFYADADAEMDKIIHAILIPNYKEELDGLRETLDVLASHPQARSSYDVSNPDSAS
jgi:hypothetical protein